MRNRSQSSTYVRLFVTIVIGSSLLATVSANRLQDGDKNKPKVSEAEAKAARAINAAPDAAAKLVAAGEFLKKFPKSSVRMQVAEYLASQISDTKDATLKLAQVGEYEKLFTEPKEKELIGVVKMEAYISADRLDEAFAAAADILATTPEDVRVLARMTFIGTDAARRGNRKYIDTSLGFGNKAIAIIETGKKPEGLDDAVWATQKQSLGQIYQHTGILFLVAGKGAEARARFEKSSTLNPNDPLNFVMIASILDQEYQTQATIFQQMPEGRQKDEMKKAINEQLDTVIEAYAHAIGLATGRPEYQSMLNQALQNIAPYYKYRHNNSTEGMQELIDKYKVTPKP